MPIRPELRWFYPIDWPQLSHWVRFTRAGGQCERCKRPHATMLICAANGSWRDDRTGQWRDSKGAIIPTPSSIAGTRLTLAMLATAHLDHNPSHNRPRNLAALCQRCHLLHDRPHHLTQRRLTHRRRWAIGDLFLGRYPAISASTASRRPRSAAMPD